MSGLHQWPQGRFVDIFNRFISPYQIKGITIQNIWMHNYHQCDHVNDDTIYNEYEVIDNNSLEFYLLIDEICSDARINQFRRAAHIVSTSILESYHSLVISYRPKRYF